MKIGQSAGREPVRVLVATPLGRGGQGGIDRLMDAVADHIAGRIDPALEVQFAPTRGQRSLVHAQPVFASFLLRLARLRVLGRVDLVHINLSSKGSTVRKLIVAGLARSLGVATVIHLHGGSYRQYWSSVGQLFNWAIARMFRKADRIIVLGNVWRDFVAGRVPEAAQRMVVLPNAVPRPVLPHVGGRGTVQILFLGRLGKRKGVPQLVEALNCIADVPGWHAMLAGDGEVEATQADVARRGLAQRVRVTGWVGPEEVAKLLTASDILTLPSFDENLPMSVVEAMAAGLAVVATPVGAVEEIVTHGETGLLVQPGNAGQLADALRQLILDAPLRARLGKAAEAVHRARLDIVPYVEQLTAIWKEVADERRR
ncbi:MAG: glycosyltransferase family 4 protein [Hyphomicrobiales bacterium]